MNVIILARGGSKGIPNKNIKLLNNKPLICYPIEAVKKTDWVDNVFVSTDSIEIARIAKESGCKIIERPSELCTDTSLDVDGFRHAVRVIGSYKPLVHLRATTPLVDPKILTMAVEKFKNVPTCTSLRSAHRFEESVYKFFKQDGEFWTGFFPELKNSEYYNLPRQHFPPNYLPNGYIDIVKPDVFMNNETFHGNKILSFITPYTIEVDHEEDFKRLVQTLEKNDI